MLVEAAIGTTAAVIIKDNLVAIFDEDGSAPKQGRAKRRRITTKVKQGTGRAAQNARSKARRAKRTGIMPRFNGRRRRAPRRRGGRKRRRSLPGRRRRKSRFRKKRRVFRPLRIYPGGFPDTHKIKLRMLKQCLIKSPNAVGWGFISFYPAMCSDPLIDWRLAQVNTTVATGGTVNHTKLAWFGTNDAGGLPDRPQPYGWDQWVANDPYTHGVVEGAKITISFIQGESGTGATQRFIAGFTKLFRGPDKFIDSGSTLTDLPQYADAAGGVKIAGENFGEKYQNVTRVEVSDLMNCGLTKRMKTLSVIGTGQSLLGAQTFTFYYSRKKHERNLKRAGYMPMYHQPDLSPVITKFEQTTNSKPGWNPVVHFIIADLAKTTAVTDLHCIVNIEYTIKLMHHRIGGQSEIPVESA